MISRDLTRALTGEADAASPIPFLHAGIFSTSSPGTLALALALARALCTPLNEDITTTLPSF